MYKSAIFVLNQTRLNMIKRCVEVKHPKITTDRIKYIIFILVIQTFYNTDKSDNIHRIMVW